MSNHTARFGLFLIFSAALGCLFSQSVFASMVDIPASSDDSKPVPAEDLGIGNFSKLPFKVSISLRSGYDDNVTTSSFGKQGSWFTGGNIAVDYNFGSPRTQLSLGAG